MAITPQQAMQLTEADKAKVKTLEREIDKAILGSNELTRHGRVTFPAPKELYPGARIYREIEKLYQKAGWKVEYHSDQRDGDWLTLRPKRGGNQNG